MFSRMMAAAALLISASTQVLADNTNFHVHNRSKWSVISGFQMYEDRRWTRDRLDNKIPPGESELVLWNRKPRDCSVPFRVTWADRATERFSMNWCAKEVTNIYLYDQGFSFD